MSEKTGADTVPGLGFKDKEKALETIKNLEGRDPDYQKLAIKGLIGRAKRTLTLTKAEDKLKDINQAVAVFEEWLKNFEKLNLGKENRAYLPLATIETLAPLKSKYNVKDAKADDFQKAYKSVDGDYKKLRTVSSGNDGPTWDIIRNSALKRLLENDDAELWEDDVPSKEHIQLIVWGYSPEASKLKKTLPKIAEQLNNSEGDGSESDDDVAPKKAPKKKSGSSDQDEKVPKKKSKK